MLDALVAAATGGVAPVQRHALEALARLAAGKSARRGDAEAAPLLRVARRCRAPRGDRRRDRVRRRGGRRRSASGSPTATDVVERRALEEVLGRVGGKDAFTALLAALDTTDVEAARAAALAVRQRVKDATPREKAGYLAAGDQAGARAR